MGARFVLVDSVMSRGLLSLTPSNQILRNPQAPPMGNKKGSMRPALGPYNWRAYARIYSFPSGSFRHAKCGYFFR